MLHENIVILCESNTVTPEEEGGGVLPYKRLMEICCWMGSHFHYWIDYYGVAYFNRVTRIGSYIFGFFRVRQFFIFMVRKHTSMFVLQMKSKVFFIESKKMGQFIKIESD